MRVLLLLLASTALSTAVVANAYFKKQQFYPTVVYLLSSSRTMGVLYLQFFLAMWVLTVVLKNLFFGTLRAAEVEHLIERSWYAVLETFILLAAFHQELSLSFVTSISILFLVKSFHWLAEDRVEFMERSPVITWKFHLRAVFLISLLLIVDVAFIRHSLITLLTRGASVQIVFGLEYAIMMLVAVNTLMCYVLHTIDLRSDDPWENKPIYLKYIDIVLGFLKLLLYISYMAFMLYVLFIPLHIARRIYIAAKNFQKSIQDVVSSHQAIRNLNTLYPDATAEELQTANNVCIICREEMAARCKKLPCNHIFHTACLRSWFQRQQTCPTCRLNVLALRHGANAARGAQAAGGGMGAGGHQQQHPQGQPPGGMPPPPLGFPPMMPAMWPGMVPPRPPQPPEPRRDEPDAPDEGAEAQVPRPPPTTSGDSAPPPGVPPPGAPPPFPFFSGSVPPPFPPPPMMPMPFMPPPFGQMPPFGAGAMPSDEALRSLSDDEVRSLEGMERANVEARIALLRNVQRLLDTAVTQLNQYSAVMATLGPAAGPGFMGHPHAPSFQPPGSTEGEAAASNPQQSSLDSAHPSASSAQPLLEPLRSYSFSGHATSSDTNPEEKVDDSASASVLNPEAPENEPDVPAGTSGWTSLEPEEEGEEGEVRSKVKGGVSSRHVENEIRQRRLQRFHSLPTSSTIKLPETIREGATQSVSSRGSGDEEAEEEGGGQS